MASACGYQCLLVEIDGCSLHRRLYIKRHSKSETDHEPEAAALFVAGIPFKLEECLEEVFGAFGAVKQVEYPSRRVKSCALRLQFNNNTRGCQTSHILFRCNYILAEPLLW